MADPSDRRLATGSAPTALIWRFRLLIGSLVAVPVLLLRAPEDELGLVLSAIGVLLGAGIVPPLLAPTISRSARAWLEWLQLILCVVLLALLTPIVLDGAPEHALPIAVAVGALAAPLRGPRRRRSVQAALIAATAWALAAGGARPFDAVVWTLVTAFLILLIGALSHRLLVLRASTARARQVADRRAALLAAVREMSQADLSNAAAEVVDAVQAVGFDGASVRLLRDELLVRHRGRESDVTRPLRSGEGITGAAVREDRTVVSDDYRRDPRRVADADAAVGSAIAVPIHDEGRPAGAVIAIRHRSGAVPAELVEAVEVLAAHLEEVMGAQRRLERQRELLARMRALDEMRDRLVGDISRQIRDPLTVVRVIAETLAEHGVDLDDRQRRELLADMTAQADELWATIGALLDFSRAQADGRSGIGSLGVEELVAGLDVAVVGEPVSLVRVDARLLRRALALLVDGGRLQRVEVDERPEACVLRLVAADEDESPAGQLLWRLAERLVLSAGAAWEPADGAVEVRLAGPARLGGALASASSVGPAP